MARFSNQIVPILLVCLSSMARGGTEIRFRDCRSAFNVTKVEVDPCPGSNPNGHCPVIRGSTPLISITFVPKWHVNNLTALVRARVSGVFVPFQLENEDACQNSNLTCPLQAGQSYTYTQGVQILPIYPKIALLVNWLLNDKANDAYASETLKREVCVIMRIEVKDAADVAK